MIPITAVVAAALAVSLLASCSPVDRAGGDAAAQVRTLRFAVSGTDQVPATLEAWAEDVRRTSDDTIKINFVTEYAALDPHQESRVLADVRSGTVDLGWTGARAYDVNGYDGFQPLLAPFVVDSYELQGRLFEEGIPQGLVAGVESIGVKPLGVLPGALFGVMSRKSAFTSASAYDGATIAAIESALTQETIAALGGTMAPLAGGPFELGKADAVLYNAGAMWGTQRQTVWHHFTANVNLWPRPLVIIANPAMFSSLAPKQQESLSGAADAIRDDALRATTDDEAAAVENLCKAGVNFDVADDAQLRKLESAVRPVIDKLRADPAKADLLDRVEVLKHEVGTAPAERNCETRTPAKTQSPAAERDTLGIPDGTYTRTITTADIDRYGADPKLKTHFKTADSEVKLVFADGLLTTYGRDETGDTEENWTYTTHRGRIKLSGAVEIVASYNYRDGELRFTDFSFPDCSDCAADEAGRPSGYYASFGFFPTPWIRQN